jgi:signal transduction histidine kinase
MRHLRLPCLCVFTLFVTTAISFGSNLEPFTDSIFSFKSELGPDQINLSLSGIKFENQPARYFDFGITTNEYCYILIKLNGPSSQGQYILSIDNTSLDSVMLYHLDQNGLKLQYLGGNYIPYDQSRNYVWHTCPLMIDPSSQYYLVAIRAFGKNVNVSYKFMKSSELQSNYENYLDIEHFYFGIVSLIIIILLVAFFLFRRVELLYYIGYILFVTGWILAHYGFLYPLLYPKFPVLNDIIKAVVSLMAGFFMICLLRVLFKRLFNARLIDKMFFWINIAIVVFIGLASIHLIFPFNAGLLIVFNVIWHVLLFSINSTLIIMIALFFHKDLTMKIFSIGIGITLFMVTFQIFASAGYLKSDFLLDHGLLLANLIEIVILTYGLGYQIWNEAREKDRQLNALESDQSQTLQKLITIQDTEQKRIAGELHDSIGPLLSAIKINFNRTVKFLSAEPNPAKTISTDDLISKTEGIIDESISEIRSIAHKLMPRGLTSKGLIGMLSDYFSNLESVHNINIIFSHSISLSLDHEVQLHLYRMISELVLNAARHSGGDTITVSIETQPTETILLVKDNGVGFDKKQKNGDSIGLKNIESRVGYLKGKLEIRTGTGEGSTVRVVIPYSQSSNS